MGSEWFFFFKIVKKWKGGYFVAWVRDTKFKFMFVDSFIGMPTSVLCAVYGCFCDGKMRPGLWYVSLGFYGKLPPLLR